jgi:hypothetical protein
MEEIRKIEENIKEYKQQKEQLQIVMSNDPHNKEILETINDLNDLIEVEEDLLLELKENQKIGHEIIDSKEIEKEYKESENIKEKKDEENDDDFKVGEIYEGMYKEKWFSCTLMNIIEPNDTEKNTDIEFDLKKNKKMNIIDKNIITERLFEVQYLGYGNTDKLNKNTIRKYQYPKKEEFKIGEKCLAIIDNIFTEALIDEVVDNKTVKVTFIGKGKSKNILMPFIRILQNKPLPKKKKIFYDDNGNRINKREAHHLKKAKESEEENKEKQDSWKSFMDNMNNKKGLKRSITSDKQISFENNFSPLKKNKKL